MIPSPSSRRLQVSPSNNPIQEAESGENKDCKCTQLVDESNPNHGFTGAELDEQQQFLDAIVRGDVESEPSPDPGEPNAAGTNMVGLPFLPRAPCQNSSVNR